MPRTKPPRHIANAVKDRGTSKRRTKEQTDQARPRGVRLAAGETLTGQGGSSRRGGRARGPHPGTRGGIKADSKNAAAAGERVPRREGGTRGALKEPHPTRHGSSKRREKTTGAKQPRALAGRRSGEKRAGTGLTKGPSRQRTETRAVGGRTRTGKDRPGPRGRARSGSRTRGRTQ
jgi:hypothetical protein